MALPMINEAREAYDNSTVTLLTPQPLVDLFSGNPGIDKIIPIPSGHIHGMMAVVKIKDLIGSQQQFDIGFILPPSFGAAASFKLAGVRDRVGYIADGRRLLLTKPLPLPEPLNAEHRSQLYFSLLRRSSGKDLTYVKPKLFIDETETKAAAAILESFAFAPDDNYVAIACRAVAESRRWGVENYLALTRRIVAESALKVVLMGGPDDRADAEQIASACGEGKVINLAGKTSLRESAAVLSRALGFVGNDSGPAHLAASVGCPIVVLSGADDPKETSPISNRKRLVRLDHLDCIGCVKNKCPLGGETYMACMKGISVDRVMTALTELLTGVGDN
jgi:heptosyltransferase-2